jgi:hypothetical protein
MACHTCKTNCTCKSSNEPCRYEGPNIDCVGITSGDSIETTVRKITDYLCSITDIPNTGEITCGTDVVVPSGTGVVDALSLITAYFCNFDHVVSSDITCGTDVVVTAGSDLTSALSSIVLYFCAAIATLPTGLVDVINNCAPIENDTDVWVVVDVTSGAYSDWNSGNATSLTNIQTLASAVYGWHTQYKLDNPSYTGNIYVVASRNESYLNYLSKIREYNFHIGSDFSFMTQTSGDDFVNTGFIDETATLIAAPSGWGDPSWTPPTSMLLISFINESATAGANYHGEVASPPNFSGQPTNTSTPPDTDYVGDYDLFQIDYPLMDFFQAVIYPVNNGTTAALNSLLHQYGVLNDTDITLAGLQAALGDNYTDYPVFASVTTGPGSNPYAGTIYNLAQYGWSGILNKQVDGAGLVDFNALEFKSDLDGILNTTSTASVLNNWNPVTGILELNGISSSSLAITQQDGCINIECGDCAPTTYGLFAQTADSTPIANTVTPGTLIGSGVGGLTVPANTFQVGDSFRGEMFGNINARNNDTITIRVKFNGASVLTLGPVTMPAVTFRKFLIETYFTIRTIGATGTVLTGIKYQHESDAADKFNGHATTQEITFDTTIDNVLDIEVEWSAADPLNSISSQAFTLTKTY